MNDHAEILNRNIQLESCLCSYSFVGLYRQKTSRNAAPKTYKQRDQEDKNLSQRRDRTERQLTCWLSDTITCTLLLNLQKKVWILQSSFPLSISLSLTEDTKSPYKHCLIFILWPSELNQTQRQMSSIHVYLRACIASCTFT